MSSLSAWPQSLSRVPSWSEYLGGDERRRHDRFRELVDSGPDAIEEELRNFVRNAPPEDVAENPRAVWQSALETLDLPGNAVRTLVYSKALGAKPTSKEQFAGLRKVYGSDLLQHMGWKPDSLIGKAGQFLAGLTLDYVMDPLTWLAGLAGAAAGTAIAPGVGTAAGAASAVAGMSGVKRLLQAIRGAEEVGKGLTVATKVGKAGRVLERLHVRPEALGKLAKFAGEEEELLRAGTKTAEVVGEGISPELAAAAKRLSPEDVYAGRWGLGAGTTPIRTTPIGHIIAGAPIIAGKLGGTATEYLGRALGKIPAVGPVIGKPIEWAGRAAQVPIDALSQLSSALGTPFKRIPKADVFMPFAEMPVVGPALVKAKAAIAASPAAAPIAEGFSKIKEGLSAMGIGPKGSLYQLLLDSLAKGRAAQRADLAKGELAALKADYEKVGREMGLDPRDVDAVSQVAAEHYGIISQAAARGRGPLEQALEETRYKVEALLGDRYPRVKVQRTTDQVMGAVGEVAIPPEMIPLVGSQPGETPNATPPWIETRPWRSQAHEKVDTTAAEAGLGRVERAALNLAVEDLHPDHLGQINWSVASGHFAGVYRKLEKGISLGLGTVSTAMEPLHEIGHFGFDYILTPEQQQGWSKWWNGLSVKRRLKRLAGPELDELRTRYVAGDPSLTSDEQVRLGLDPDTWSRVQHDSSREAFATLVARHSLSRRAVDPEPSGLLDRVRQSFLRVYRGLRSWADPRGRKMSQLMESMFSPEQLDTAGVIDYNKDRGRVVPGFSEVRQQTPGLAAEPGRAPSSARPQLYPVIRGPSNVRVKNLKKHMPVDNYGNLRAEDVTGGAEYMTWDLDAWVKNNRERLERTYGKEESARFIEGMVRTRGILASAPGGLESVLPPAVGGSPIRKNSDPLFGVTRDLTTICPKQDEYRTSVHALEKHYNKLFTAKQRFLIAEMMADAGSDRPCWFCYGQAARDAADDAIQKAVDVWNLSAREIRRNPKVSDQWLQKNAFGTWSTHPGDKPLSDPLRAVDEPGALIHPPPAEPGVLLQAIRSLTPRLFAEGYELNPTRLRDLMFEGQAPASELEGQVLEAVRAVVQGGVKPNVPKGFSEYSGEYLRPEFAQRYNKSAGHRMNSQTDGRPWDIVETVQGLAHLGEQGGMAHLYLREPYLVEVLGRTGTKMNLSVELTDPLELQKLRKQDPRLQDLTYAEYQKLRGTYGAPTWNDMQGYPYAAAMEDRAKYPRDVGTMLVGTSDYQIWSALDDADIDMSIPFHAGRVPKEVVLYKDAKDYTPWQHEKVIATGKDYHEPITREQHNNDKAQYLEFCRQNGLTPRYPQFVEHPNYMKLVRDVAREPSNQVPVDPRMIDWEAAFRVTDEYVRRGKGPGGFQAKANPALIKHLRQRIDRGDWPTSHVRPELTESLRQPAADLPPMEAREGPWDVRAGRDPRSEPAFPPRSIDAEYLPADPRREPTLPERAISLDLPGDAVTPGGLAGRHSRAWTEGHSGNLASARKWANEVLTSKHATSIAESVGVEDPSKLVFVPVPSPSRNNALPEAMAERLAKLTGGTSRPLLETKVTQERVRKGVLRRLGNSRNFVPAKDVSVPEGSTIVLVDDFMYSGGTARDATHALNSAGVEVSGVAVGRGLRPRMSTALRPGRDVVDQIRALAGNQAVPLERSIGRTLLEMTAGEADEVRARLESGQSADSIIAMIEQGKRAPTADRDLPDASPINPDTLRPLDDMLQGEDRLVMEVRAAIAAGAKPNSRAVVEYAKTNWTPETRKTLLGVAKLGSQGGEVARAVIDTALLKLGHPYHGRNWENIYEQLQHAEKGELPSRGQGWNYSQGLEGVLYEGTLGPTYAPRLTTTGARALTAMREAARVGGDPDHVARTMSALADVKISMMQKQRSTGIMPQGLRARAARLERVLANMGRTITDDAAWVATHASKTIEGGAAGPPPMPGAAPAGPAVKAPRPHEIWAAPVADLVVRMQRLAEKSRGELNEAGIRVPNVKTERGLGYFPRMLGDPGTVLGKIMRHWGMSWEAEAAKLRGLQQRQSGQEGPRDAYHFVTEAILRENTARMKKGLEAIPVPSRDSPLSRQIAEILDTYPELRPEHRAQLHRQFLVESTIDEINQIAEHTGVSMKSDPVAVWTAYRMQEHMAIAGADYLREVIRSGVDAGWAVKVSPKGETPKGFERITDGRFGNLAKGYAFSAEIVRDFKKFQGHVEKPHALFKAFDWVTSQFRTAVLSVAPYTVTNLLSGTFQNMFFDAYHPESYTAAFAMMDDYHRGLNLDKPIAQYFGKDAAAVKAFGATTLREKMELLSIEYGEFGRGNYGVELAGEVSANIRDEWSVIGQFKEAMKRGQALFPEPAKTTLGRAAQKTLGAAGGLMGVVRGDAGGVRVGLNEGAYFKAFRAVNAYAEDGQGLAHILERMRRGATIDEAVQTKRLALNQSADLTDLEQNTFRRLIPFWGWMKGNAMLQWRMAVARPQMAGLVAKIRGNLEAAMVGDESLPASMRPRHVAGELGVQLTGGEKPEFYNLTRLFPIAELGLTPLEGTKLPGNIMEEAVQRLNPVLKVPIEVATNRDIFWDRPLTEYAEQKKTWMGMRLSPATKNIMRMIRPLNVMEQVSWRGVPTTPGEAGAFAAQSAGARLFPVDVARQVFEREKVLRDQLSSVMRDMYRRRREVERAGGDWRTDAEVLRLSGIYSQLSEEKDRLPIKALRGQSVEQRREAKAARGELKEMAISN